MERRIPKPIILVLLASALLSVVVFIFGFWGDSDETPSPVPGVEAESEQEETEIPIEQKSDEPSRSTQSGTLALETRSAGVRSSGEESVAIVPNKLIQIPMPTGPGPFRFTRFGTTNRDDGVFLPRTVNDSEILALARRKGDVFEWYLQDSDLQPLVEELLQIVDHIVFSREPDQMPAMPVSLYLDTIETARDTLVGSVDVILLLEESPTTVIMKLRDSASWLLFRVYREDDAVVDLEFWKEPAVDRIG